jgi:GH18 family chitinase
MNRYTSVDWTNAMSYDFNSLTPTTGHHAPIARERGARRRNADASIPNTSPRAFQPATVHVAFTAALMA